MKYPDDPREAIDRLFADHGERIYRIGRSLCYDPEHAEDLVQETFLQAYRSWPQFEGRSSVFTWLYAIASRVCQRMQRLRAGEPNRMQPLDVLLESTGPEPDWTPGVGESPLDFTIRNEEVARLRRAISELPVAFRLPLVLKELEGLSVHEVAEILGLREATVKTRLHRARLAIRDSVVASPAVGTGERVEHARRECADLITAKLEAMANGVEFPIDNEHVCARCASTLDALDRSAELCADLRLPSLPVDLRARVVETLDQFERAN